MGPDPGPGTDYAKAINGAGWRYDSPSEVIMRIKGVGWRTAVAAVAFAAPFALTACTHGKATSGSWKNPAPTKPAVVNVTPAGGSANQPVTTEIGTTVTNGTL